MKEIVFSDSAKGSMKVAQRWNAEDMLRDGPTSFFGRRPSDEELRRMWAGEALGGNTQDVLGLSFFLHIGDISGGAAGPARRAEMRRLWQWMPEDAFEQHCAGCVSDLNTAKEAAKAGEKLRVWVSDAPAAACGLRQLLWEIRDCDCPVSVIELPRLWPEGDGTVVGYTDWSEVEPGRFARFLPLERGLCWEERRAMSYEWAEAVQENMPLRAVVNGKLLGVPEDFYDHLIRRYIPEGPFRMARLIGETLGRHPIGIGDDWYALRLEEMIRRGELRVIDPGDGDHPYAAVLCRN